MDESVCTSTAPRLAGIILAAGPSTRLGHPKQLVKFAGVPLVTHAAAQLLANCDAGVVVVTGADHEAVVAALTDLPVRAVYNPGWREGMGSSVRQGVIASSPEAAAVLIMPADVPRVGAAALKRLVDAWHGAPERVAAAHYRGTVGTPAIFPRPIWPELAKLHGDRGAKRVIDAADRVTSVEMPEAAFDVDTPEDVAEL